MKFFDLFCFFLLQLLISNIYAAKSRTGSSESDILNQILENYNGRLKPPTGNSTEVKVNLFIRSIKNICSIKQEITVQLTFRCKWNDPRLDFQQYSVLNYITITDRTIIWVPDLFISNAVHGNHISVLKPNVLIRIFRDGTVLLSDNVLVTLSCPMNLRSYPFDTQSCPLSIASYAYKNDELMVKWDLENPVQISPKLYVPSFSLTNYWHKEGYSKKTNSGSYSYIELILKFRRSVNNYVLNIFIPSAMLVIISWLSFWIDVRQQILKSIICLTSIITLFISLTIINNRLPQVNYTKTLDCWTGICLLFIFAAFVESIVIYYRSIKNTNSTNENSLDKHVSIVTNEDGLLMNNEFVKKYLPFLIDTKSDKIDCWSSCVFPILFLLFTIVYFVVCFS